VLHVRGFIQEKGSQSTTTAFFEPGDFLQLETDRPPFRSIESESIGSVTEP